MEGAVTEVRCVMVFNEGFRISGSFCKNVLLIACWVICGGNSCSKEELAPPGTERQSFSGGFSAGKVTADELTEISGIAGGINNPGFIWAHNDSGDEPRIFALTEEGKHIAVYYLKGAQAIDWEDMASGPGPVPGKNYLYIADIGDNLAKRSGVEIYRFEEPVLKNRDMPYTDTVEKSAIDVFTLKYEDGPRDAETFMIDPLSGNAYIVTKRENESRLYQVKLPPDCRNSLSALDTPPARARLAAGDKAALPGRDTLVLELAGILARSGMTGGDISPDGSEIVLKNYNRLFYWQRTGTTALEQVMAYKARRLPYVPEPQGEAIAWKKDGSGFFTLSEEAVGIAPVLYWYKRR